MTTQLKKQGIVFSLKNKLERDVYTLDLCGQHSELTQAWQEAIGQKKTIERNSNHINGKTVIRPDLYVEYIVGDFFIPESRVSLAYIPASIVVGASWRGHSKISSQQAKQKISNFDQAAIEYDTTICSIYNWLFPLPIVWAGEGKNRVQLYYDNKIEVIFTNIAKSIYPPAHMLTLRKVINSKNWILQYSGKDLCSKYYLSCWLSKNQFLLPMPDSSLPILKAYGVKVGCVKFLPFAERLRLNFFKSLLASKLS